MNILANSSGLGFARPLSVGANAIPDAKDPKYLEFLADDKQFLQALSAAMTPNGVGNGAAGAYQSIIDAASANVGNLSPEERAQIIQAAKMIRVGYNANTEQAAQQVVQKIQTLSNNQGYTGPDAGTVVTTTPAAGGGTHAVTRGEILDNENFGNLVNTVFTAAGGKPPVVAGSLILTGSLSGMPGNLFNNNNDSPLTGIDLSKWSEAERIEYLNKVAQFGSDGSLSWQEQGELRNMAMGYSRNGDNEPTAVTANNGFGKPTAISKDDLMENGTFEKQLSSMVSGFPLGGGDPDTKALKDAIATANYDELDYDERVALIQAFNAANSDRKIDAQEAAGLKQMLESFQKSSGSGGTSNGGTALSNGLVVSKDDVATDDNFMSMVNAVLDRSGATAGSTSAFGMPSFSNNQYTLPMLRGLDTSKLTPEQRIEVLEMIAQAASDREVTRDEANNILKRVNELSGRPALPFLMT
jgi:hypothetical protein